MTESYEIVPHKGVGSLRFGMTREQVRAHFSETPQVGRRSPTSEPYDFFVNLDFFCYYDAESLLKAVEFATAPSVLLNGQELCRITLSDAREFPSFSEHHEGFLSKEFGVSLWFESKEADNEEDQPRAGSVLVFRPGYYG